MKIAYIVPMTWTCGGIIAPFFQVNELVRRGHDVRVFAAQADPVNWFPLRAPLAPIPRNAGDAVSADLVVFVGDTFLAARHIHATRQFLLLQGKDYLRKYKARREAMLRAYRDPRFHILAVSEWLAEFVRGKCGNTNVSVLGNGIDPDRFFPDPRPREGMRLLIEGAFPDPHKNVLDALEVSSRVRQHQAIEVWAMGRTFVRPGALVDRIFEDPPQDSFPGIYRQCDLLIKTSVTEGFGLPHLEAMSCGCVPATYASGGVMDFCRHDENSLITGVGNIPGLVWQVLRFLSEPDLRTHLRKNAIATAVARTWSKAADRLEQIFFEAMENPS